MKKRSLWIYSIVIVMLGFGMGTLAADLHCDVCSMKILESSSQHFLIKAASSEKKPLHVCSVTCLHKMKSTNSELGKVEITSFKSPQRGLPAEKAFFLVKSENVKKDVDSMTMPPLIAAFSTKKEAEDAQKKYGDGIVVSGIENVLKSLYN